MTAGFVLAFIVLPFAAGISALRHHMRRYRSVADGRRDEVRTWEGALWGDDKAQVLNELQAENVRSAGHVIMVKRPRFGQPTRLEPYYEDPKITAEARRLSNIGKPPPERMPPMCCIDAAPADGPWPEPCDRCWKPGGYVPPRRLEPGRPTLDLLEHEPPWPDRHEALYRRLPWQLRRLIISHYTKEQP